MVCPLCGTRKARRACPALKRDICAVCCGTKRLVEINCPSDCGYLTASRAHPPAAQVRQRERDARFLAPVVRGLTERSLTLLFLFHDIIRRHKKSAIPPVVDEDVADAAASLASTLETSGRGIIYEHRATSLPAQRLQGDLQRGIDEVVRAGGSPGAVERDAAAGAPYAGPGSQGGAARTRAGPDGLYGPYRPRVARQQFDRGAGGRDGAGSAKDHCAVGTRNEPRLDGREAPTGADSGAKRLNVLYFGVCTAGRMRVRCAVHGGRGPRLMAQRCEICGKGPSFGRNVSHAHNVTPRRFNPNLQTVRASVNGGTKRLRVCTRCLRSGKVVKAA